MTTCFHLALRLARHPQALFFIGSLPMRFDFTDHGLPLIQLKEARRDLVLSLQGASDPISQDVLAQIVNVQIAISAVEAVIEDLDNETDGMAASNVAAFMSGRA
jgi:hypothetical protein